MNLSKNGLTFLCRRTQFVFVRCMLWLFLAVVFSAKAGQSGDFTFQVNSTYTAVTITQYTGQGGAVVIPGTINGLPVTAIGNNAFAYCANLASISIPESVTFIGTFAFNFCTNLESITISNSSTSIGDYAFTFCTRLVNVNVPNSVGSIGVSAFDHCRSLASIILPDGVTSIGDFAFLDCTNLTSVSLPDSITAIGQMAFGDCFSLSSIILPNKITNIWVSAFDSCWNLTNVFIPDSVTFIADCAFRYCTNLASINIPKSVTSIGASAFYDCARLENVILPNSVISIGNEAFEYCANLTRFSLPNRLTNVSYKTFFGCGLVSVTIPDSVATIGEYAFSCSSLKSIFFQGNPPYVESNSFYHAYTATMYYLSNASGWNETFAGRPTALWNLQFQSGQDYLGVRTNLFGFLVAWENNQVVVVEACTNIANPSWFPVSTNLLSGGSYYFSDAEWRNYPQRFYRLRLP